MTQFSGIKKGEFWHVREESELLEPMEIIFKSLLCHYHFSSLYYFQGAEKAVFNHVLQYTGHKLSNVSLDFSRADHACPNFLVHMLLVICSTRLSGS